MSAVYNASDDFASWLWSGGFISATYSGRTVFTQIPPISTPSYVQNSSYDHMETLRFSGLGLGTLALTGNARIYASLLPGASIPDGTFFPTYMPCIFQTSANADTVSCLLRYVPDGWASSNSSMNISLQAKVINGPASFVPLNVSFSINALPSAYGSVFIPALVDTAVAGLLPVEGGGVVNVTLPFAVWGSKELTDNSVPLPLAAAKGKSYLSIDGIQSPTPCIVLGSSIQLSCAAPAGHGILRAATISLSGLASLPVIGNFSFVFPKVFSISPAWFQLPPPHSSGSSSSSSSSFSPAALNSTTFNITFGHSVAGDADADMALLQDMYVAGASCLGVKLYPGSLLQCSGWNAFESSSVINDAGAGGLGVPTGDTYAMTVSLFWWNRAVSLLPKSSGTFVLRPTILTRLPQFVTSIQTLLLTGANLCPPEGCKTDKPGNLHVILNAGTPGLPDCDNITISPGGVTCILPVIDPLGPKNISSYPNYNITFVNEAGASSRWSQELVITYPKIGEIRNATNLPSSFVPSDASFVGKAWPLPLPIEVQLFVDNVPTSSPYSCSLATDTIGAILLPITVANVGISIASNGSQNTVNFGYIGVSVQQDFDPTGNSYLETGPSVQLIVKCAAVYLAVVRQFSFTVKAPPLRIEFCKHPAASAQIQVPMPPFSVALIDFPESQRKTSAAYAPSCSFSANATLYENTSLPAPITCTISQKGGGTLAVEVVSPTTRLATFSSAAVSAARESNVSVSVSCSIGKSIALPRMLFASIFISGCAATKEPFNIDNATTNAAVCTPCPENTYSLAGDPFCTLCPPVGVTCTNGILTLADGYFRPPGEVGKTIGPNSLLMPCAFPAGCIVNHDTSNTTEQYSCAWGYRGALCGVCDESNGYGQVGDACIPCKFASNIAAVVIVACVILFLLAGRVIGGSEGVAMSVEEEEEIKERVMKEMEEERLEEGSRGAVFLSTTARRDGKGTAAAAAAAAATLEERIALAVQTDSEKHIKKDLEGSISLRIFLGHIQMLGALQALKLSSADVLKKILGWTAYLGSSAVSQGPGQCLFRPTYTATFFVTISAPLLAGATTILILIGFTIATTALARRKAWVEAKKKERVSGAAAAVSRRNSMESLTVTASRWRSARLKNHQDKRARRSLQSSQSSIVSVSSGRIDPLNDSKDKELAAVARMTSAKALADHFAKAEADSALVRNEGLSWSSFYAASVELFVQRLQNKRHIAAFLFVVHLSFMPVISSCLKAFNCTPKIDNLSYVVDSLAQTCSGPEYTAIMVFAYIVIILFGAGYPIFIFIFFTRIVRKDTSKLVRPKFAATWGFLYSGYRYGIGAGKGISEGSTNPLQVAEAAGSPSASSADTGISAVLDADALALSTGMSAASTPAARTAAVAATRSPTPVKNSACWAYAKVANRNLVWWESTVLLRKAGIVFIGNLISEPSLQIVAMSLWIVAFIALHFRFIPYTSQAFNVTEGMSLIAIAITSILCSVSYDATKYTVVVINIVCLLVLFASYARYSLKRQAEKGWKNAQVAKKVAEKGIAKGITVLADFVPGMEGLAEKAVVYAELPIEATWPGQHQGLKKLRRMPIDKTAQFWPAEWHDWTEAAIQDQEVREDMEASAANKDGFSAGSVRPRVFGLVKGQPLPRFLAIPRTLRALAGEAPKPGAAQNIAPEEGASDPSENAAGIGGTRRLEHPATNSSGAAASRAPRAFVLAPIEEEESSASKSAVDDVDASHFAEYDNEQDDAEGGIVLQGLLSDSPSIIRNPLHAAGLEPISVWPVLTALRPRGDPEDPFKLRDGAEGENASRPPLPQPPSLAKIPAAAIHISFIQNLHTLATASLSSVHAAGSFASQYSRRLMGGANTPIASSSASLAETAGALEGTSSDFLFQSGQWPEVNSLKKPMRFYAKSPENSATALFGVAPPFSPSMNPSEPLRPMLSLPTSPKGISEPASPAFINPLAGSAAASRSNTKSIRERAAFLTSVPSRSTLR